MIFHTVFFFFNRFFVCWVIHWLEVSLAIYGQPMEVINRTRTHDQFLDVINEILRDQPISSWVEIWQYFDPSYIEGDSRRHLQVDYSVLTQMLIILETDSSAMNDELTRVIEEDEFVLEMERLLQAEDYELYFETRIALIKVLGYTLPRLDVTTLPPRIRQTLPNSMPPTPFKTTGAPTTTTLRPSRIQTTTVVISRYPTRTIDFNLTLPVGTPKPRYPTVMPSARPRNRRPLDVTLLLFSFMI